MQSSSQIVTQANTQLGTGRIPFLSPNQQCQSTEGKTLANSNAMYICKLTIETPQVSLRWASPRNMIVFPSVLWRSVVKVVIWSRGGEGGLTWRRQMGANPIPIPHPTNLVLFGHKITLYRFNQGGLILLQGGSNRSRGAEPPSL